VCGAAGPAGASESPAVAATRLGAWQATGAVVDLPWLAGHQLAQRVAASELDWAEIDGDPRLAAIWARRHELLARLRDVPTVLSHGDFHLGNLIAAGDTTVALDWGTFGVAPAGTDLAHLALSTLHDLVADYLRGLDGHVDAAAVRTGYGTTVALTGASRMHWMRSRGLQVPAGYADFVAAHLD
jgi:aminoglycoside phosphotransferase (APT) family kinase protein